METGESPDLQIIETHRYNYQIQGQMGIIEIQKCILIGYTNKGLHPVTVKFDDTMQGTLLICIYFFKKNTIYQNI